MSASNDWDHATLFNHANDLPRKNSSNEICVKQRLVI